MQIGESSIRPGGANLCFATQTQGIPLRAAFRETCGLHPPTPWQSVMASVEVTVHEHGGHEQSTRRDVPSGYLQLALGLIAVQVFHAAVRVTVFGRFFAAHPVAQIEKCTNTSSSRHEHANFVGSSREKTVGADWPVDGFRLEFKTTY